MRSRSSSTSESSAKSIDHSVQAASIRNVQSSIVERLHFDIDRYINTYIPPPPTYLLPSSILYVLGYRCPSSQPTKRIGNIVVATSTLFTTFIGLLTLTSLFKYADDLADMHPPVLIGSLAASAILLFTSTSSPFAQPRPALLGHVLSAAIGVLLAQNTSLSHAWLIAPLSCAVAASAMTLTGTVHPPGGAAAVLAVVDSTARGLGWRFVALVAIGMTVMIGVATLLGNTVGGRYPLWWWSEKPTGQFWKQLFRSDSKVDLERGQMPLGDNVQVLESVDNRHANTLSSLRSTNEKDGEVSRSNSESSAASSL